MIFMVKFSKQIMTGNYFHISGRGLKEILIDYRAWGPSSIKLSVYRSKVHRGYTFWCGKMFEEFKPCVWFTWQMRFCCALFFFQISDHVLNCDFGAFSNRSEYNPDIKVHLWSSILIQTILIISFFIFPSKREFEFLRFLLDVFKLIEINNELNWT